MEYDLKKLLFSELVYLKDNDKENSHVYYKEIYGRLSYCGFDEKLINSIIDHESDILKTNNFKLKEIYVDKKYWLNQNFVPKLTKDRDKYGVFQEPIGPTLDTLCTSELLFLNDEISYILVHSDEINNKEILDEIKKFMPNEDDPWLQHEFFSRINYYNWLLYNEPKNKELREKELIFFRNELQILFVNKHNHQEDSWMPYSQEYYNVYG